MIRRVFDFHYPHSIDKEFVMKPYSGLVVEDNLIATNFSTNKSVVLGQTIPYVDIRVLDVFESDSDDNYCSFGFSKINNVWVRGVDVYEKG